MDPLLITVHLSKYNDVLLVPNFMLRRVFHAKSAVAVVGPVHQRRASVDSLHWPSNTNGRVSPTAPRQFDA